MPATSRKIMTKQGIYSIENLQDIGDCPPNVHQKKNSRNCIETGANPNHLLPISLLLCSCLTQINEITSYN